MNPSGNVTFLFTDIEGSTKLAQDYPETLQSALDIHHAIMNKAIESNNGFVFEIVGDAFCCAFEKAEDAVKAAVDAQINLAKEKWNEAVIKIRIGIHSGTAEWNVKRYMGYITLARSARVMSCGYGEQIIISNSAYELCRDKFDAVKEKNVTFRDLGERRLKDVIQPIRLYQILCPGLREDFPPLMTLDAYPNNLPVQLTGFIGRAEEIKQVKKLLKNAHLLTLTGSGGSGKTRLSLQVAADVIDDFANGVWYIELASLSDSTFLPQTIMKVFELKEETGRIPEDTLFDYLRDKKMLIIFDNCEHLIEGCALLTERLLVNCPNIKILATSRESLRCEGEHTHRVISLECPDPKDENIAENLIQYEAVRLFIERAKALDRNFSVNNENAPALAEICYQLDGIPLAIELAAARTKILSIEKIHERLYDRFNFLTGGRRTSLPRQQTLKALIDWSYDLLIKKEKLLLGRLSVFTGGWSLEASEEICSDENIDKGEVLDLLNQLSEKSMIIYDTENERYKILQTMKKYGESKLIETGDTDKILTKHLSYFTELVENVRLKLSGSEVGKWTDILDSDHSNLQSAIEWSLEKNLKERSILLAISLGKFWDIRGYYSIGRRLIGKILEESTGISNFYYANALNLSGILCYKQGEYENSIRFLLKSLKLFREQGKKKEIAMSTLNLGNSFFRIGELGNACKSFEEGLELFKEIGNKLGVANSLLSLGATESSRGNLIQAKNLHEESLAIYRELDEKNGILLELLNLGSLEYDCENYEKADNYYSEGLELGREIGDKRRLGFALYGKGSLSCIMKDYAQSQNFFEESLNLVKEIGDKRGICHSLYGLGKLAFAQKQYEQSQKYFEYSLELGRSIKDKQSIANTLYGLGKVIHILQGHNPSKKFFNESLILSLSLGDKRGIAESIISIAGILKDNDNFNNVLKLLGTVEGAMKSSDIFLEKEEQLVYEQIQNDYHKKLTDEEFSEYFEEGKKMTLEEACQLAINS